MSKNKKRREPRVSSKQAAIEEAAARVTELFEVQPGRWCYHVWSTKDSAWIPGMHTDGYAEARRKRASTIAAMAADTLLRDGAADKPEIAWQIIGLAYNPDNTGTVRERVDRILEHLC